MRIDFSRFRRSLAIALSAGAVLAFSGVAKAQAPTPPQADAPKTDATPGAAGEAPTFDANAAKQKGDEALKAGDYQTALVAYNDIVANIAKATTQDVYQAMTLVGYIGRGKALAGLKEYEAAIDDFKHILDADPGSVPALIARGTVYLDTNQADSALVDFQMATKAERSNLEALFGLGKALVTLGRAEEAVTPLTRVITADPKNAEAYRLRGTGYAGQFKTKQAIEDLQQAISLNPDDYEAYATLGIVHLRAEEYQNAVDQFAKAIEHYKPKAGQEDLPYAQGYLTLATAYTELGKHAKDEAASKAAYKSAMGECEKLLAQLDAKNPTHAQARAAAIYSRGVAERMQGEYVPAIKSFTEALELNPELGDAYFRRGICFHKLNEDQMAVSDFERAAHIPPYDDPRYNLWAGLTHAKLGEYHKALRSYGDAIAASDRYTPAYYNRGLTYMQLGEYEKAVADFNESIRLAPNKAEYYFKRGVALQKQRDYKKASESFATAIAFDNKYAAAYRHMSEVLTALGHSELAGQYKQKADQLEPPKTTK
jgi:tetratricopeptide (TPR) repeat protein